MSDTTRASGLRLLGTAVFLVASIGSGATATTATSVPDDGACSLPCVETFDDGKFDHATLSGLWHVSQTCTAAWSLPNYLGFNQDSTCTYPEGTRFAGEARLWLDLSNTTAASLRFMEIHSTEGAKLWDQTSFDVSRDGGATWTPLMSPSHSRSTAWRRLAFDLSTYTGSNDVVVRWRFDTVDRIINDYRGWLIDDVTVVPYPLCGNNDARTAACTFEGLPYQNHQMTTGFTDEPSEVPACGVGTASAWYTYRHWGPAAVVTIQTLGSTFDTLTAVYHQGLLIACNDDEEILLPTESKDSRLSFPAGGGGTYSIQVAGRSGQTGSLFIEVKQ